MRHTARQSNHGLSSTSGTSTKGQKPRPLVVSPPSQERPRGPPLRLARQWPHVKGEYMPLFPLVYVALMYTYRCCYMTRRREPC